MKWYEKLEKIREFISDTELLNAVGNYFDADQMNDFCEQMIIDFDLENEFEED